MGLDITAYSKLELIEASATSQDDELYKKGDVFLYDNGSFPNAMFPLVPGIYKLNGTSFGFRAGSYSGYNQFRDLLAECIGTSPQEVWDNPTKHETAPFYRLINFSDCEGTIGSVHAAILDMQFRESKKQFVKFLKVKNKQAIIHDYVEYYTACYNNWAKAFKLAQNGGAVTFH